METSNVVHPLGEGKMSFQTAAGQVYLEASDEAMTPFGGFVPLAAFFQKLGVFDSLASSCPVERSSPNASRIHDVLLSFILACLCDGSRFNHINRLREDPTLCELFGLKKIVSDDTVRRLFGQISPEQSGDWIAKASSLLWRAAPEHFILDWDSTVQTRYGNQEGAEVGYNPHKRGRKSHHPLLAVIAGTRLCPYYRWRAGNTGSSSQWLEAMEKAEQWMGVRPWLNRGDVGFCSEKIMAWHEQSDKPDYLFKLRLTKNLKRAIVRLDDSDWEGCPSPGLLQSTELKLQLTGWSQPRRVVVARRLLGHIGGEDDGEFWSYAKYEYEAYVTSLSLEYARSWQVVELYRKRADCENVFDELKNQWGFNGFCSRYKEVTETAARLLLVAYNTWNLFLRLLEPDRHVEARHGRRWFLFISARLVKTSRQRIWKLAISGNWRAELMQGYQRVLAWLNLTAPQLESIRANAPPKHAEIVSI